MLLYREVLACSRLDACTSMQSLKLEKRTMGAMKVSPDEGLSALIFFHPIVIIVTTKLFP